MNKRKRKKDAIKRGKSPWLEELFSVSFSHTEKGNVCILNLKEQKKTRGHWRDERITNAKAKAELKLPKMLRAFEHGQPGKKFLFTRLPHWEEGRAYRFDRNDPTYLDFSAEGTPLEFHKNDMSREEWNSADWEEVHENLF